MMTRWSGQQWYESAPSPSGAATVTLLGMTEDEMKSAEHKRRPLGFAPPVQAVTVKPRIRAKVRS